MIRTYLKTSLPITALFSVTVLLATIVGSHRTQPAAMNGFDDCRLPCWHSITPEQTITETASSLLAESGYELQVNNVHWRYMVYTPFVTTACNVALTYETRVLMTELNECTGLTLGDVTAILGAPQSVVPSIPYDSFGFRDGMIEVVARREGCAVGFSLYAEVTSIRLRARRTGDMITDTSAYSVPWRGFVLMWRYDPLRLCP